MIANVVWPSLYLADQLVAPAVIAASLLVESAALQFVLKRSALQLLALVFGINFVSAAIGGYIIATAGYHWEMGPGLRIAEALYEGGTFNAVSWSIAVGFAIFVNTFIESCVAAVVFRVRSYRAFCWLAIANTITVLLAYFSVRF